ncbi:glycerophosphodiester phosphodiesterase family protein [Falsirhodobacter deserti]|uniref:glycerophosphodiester phosphodiesterase family protein n=1 Tax=Falsirhodobacter deserti TaxID=1365611 RepID=UPI000FE3DD12|nr:glycerophosphodiester phosphodiesterase family protein [Falsirhodobacter deserti]
MPKIMAHRGARNLWAENSLLGFRETVALGFDAIEFDLHVTDAGQLVVIHDAMLDRTTTGTGPVRALTDESRRALRLKGPDGKTIDEGVPTFEEALEILRQGSADLYVELKGDEAGRSYSGMAAMAAAVLDRHGLRDRSVLHSFDIAVVREIRDTAPGFRRLISVNRDWADRQGGIATFLGEVDGLVDIVGIHHELYEAEIDTIAAIRPMETTSVWTINDADTIRRWAGTDVGFIVSDDPVLARSLAG